MSGDDDDCFSLVSPKLRKDFSPTCEHVISEKYDRLPPCKFLLSDDSNPSSHSSEASPQLIRMKLQTPSVLPSSHFPFPSST